MAKFRNIKGHAYSLLERVDIGRPGEAPYLRRWYIIQTPWFGIYLHNIRTPDPDEHPHDHPRNFLSIVLRGGYEEKVFQPTTGRIKLVSRFSYVPGDWHTMPKDLAHMITKVKPNTWTLLFLGRRTRVWGFHTEDGWIPWQEYLKRYNARSKQV